MYINIQVREISESNYKTKGLAQHKRTNEMYSQFNTVPLR